MTSLMIFLHRAGIFLACLLLGASSLHAQSHEEKAREEVGHLIRLRHGGSTPGHYEGWKAAGYSDAELVEAFRWWIEQPDLPDGKKHGATAVNAARSGLYLFPEDAGLHTAVIEAQRHPERYVAGVSMRYAVPYSGSEKMLAEFRQAGFDIPEQFQDMGAVRATMAAWEDINPNLRVVTRPRCLLRRTGAGA